LRLLIVGQATGTAKMHHRNESHPYGAETKPARPSLVARFVGNRRGTTAIEFGVLALPFALLVFAILESCISFGAQQLLANATDEVARQVRTGQLKGAALNQTELQKRLCSKIRLMVGPDCKYLHFDLEHYDKFSDAAAVRTKVVDGNLVTADFVVDPGGPLTINMLRVFYEWPVMTDFMASMMSNLKGNRTLLFATSTWQNEPF
jgi:Flp pilus assembly protein TadG